MSRLLSRRIVAETEKRLEGRQSPRLYEFYVHVPILSVPGLILGAVIQHVLVSKLDTDLSGDVGKLVQIFDVVSAAASGVRLLAPILSKIPIP
jgi:hypothetical protein